MENENVLILKSNSSEDHDKKIQQLGTIGGLNVNNFIYDIIDGTTINFDDYTSQQIINQLNIYRQYLNLQDNNIVFDKFSIKIAIEIIWESYPTDLPDFPEIVPDNNHMTWFVNTSSSMYQDDLDFRQENNLDFRAVQEIHPILFPLLYKIVFPNNTIPYSEQEDRIRQQTINYNEDITTHNRQYIQNDLTKLFILRREQQNETNNKSNINDINIITKKLIKIQQQVKNFQ